jgi:hypothetical protein
MIRTASAAALLLLSACNQETTTKAPTNNVAADEPKAAAEVPSLEGNWRVTMIEGKDVAGLGMTASFSGGQASLATGCLRRAWSYTQKRNVVSFKTNPGGSSNCGGQTPGGDEETAYAALDGANIAIFAKQGKEASLSGIGGNLTLERR